MQVRLASFLVSSTVVALLAVACTSTPDDLGLVFPADEADAASAVIDASPPPPTAAETCEGQLPASRACYTGPAATRGKGRCKDGELTCTSKGQTVCLGEVLPAPAEACNDVDDNCDGVIDDGFDKATSPLHCGACNKACASDEHCTAGKCEKRTETSCSNGVDDDGDGKADCADTECNDQACGTGCTCTGGIRVETLCADGLDNDGDGAVDCADPSCNGKSCGAGCLCAPTAGKVETDCADGVDNDGANGTDCADPACADKSCGAGCLCVGVTKDETICNDGVDNDGDGKTDCADPACENKSCGAGCTCAANGQKKETNCADRLDNDGNNGADCADSADCPQGTVCKMADGNPGSCQPDKSCR